MNFAKELFLGNQDVEWIHKRFIRYGRGDFDGPFIEAKLKGNKVKVNASEDYVNVLGLILCQGNVDFNGTIISEEELDSILESNGIQIVKKSKRKGVFHYKVESSLEGEKLASFYEKCPSAWFLLNINSGYGKLKTKGKLQKVGSSLDGKFCQAEIDNELKERFRAEICFDLQQDFKELEISHTYVVEKVEIPEEYKNDFKKARIYAKRVGLIKRVIRIDNSIKETEKELRV